MGFRLQRQVEKLKEDILTLGAAVEEQLLQAVRAIENRDADLARQVIDADMKIDQMEVDFEEECLKILALYQPVAIDLRYIIAVLKINNDLERIGDLATNLARRARFFSKLHDVEMPDMFKEMALKSSAMLCKSLDALVKLNVELANEVCMADDEVDALHKNNYLLVHKGIERDPQRLDFYLNLFLTSSHLERIADQTTNIAEDVIYLIRGEIVRHSHEKKTGAKTQ